jgi:MFS family permease
MSELVNDSRLLSITPLTPDVYRANIRHFYAEITWMGFAFAMEWYYLNVYAIHLNATAVHLAVLTSGRALLMMLGAGLAQRWQRRHPGPIRAISIPLISSRLLLYLGIVLVPFLPAFQVEALVGLVLLSALPTGIAQGIFLGMLPGAVPKEVLARVVARRAVLMNAGVLPCILLLSQLLGWFPQPANYQVGFFISFLTSLMSTWHIHQIKTIELPKVTIHIKPINVWANASFRRFALLTVANQTGVFMAASLIGLQLVRGLNASDSWISIFGVCEMLAGILVTFRLDWIIARFGTRRLIIVACVAVALQTLILSLTPTLPPFLVGSLMFGSGWFSVNVLLYSRLVELFPPEEIGHYAATFQLLVNGSLFLGPLLGTLFIEGGMTLPAALFLITGVRLLAAFLAWAIKIKPQISPMVADSPSALVG